MSDKKRILHLNLKHKWFDQIASGEKTEELRLANDHWRKKLTGRDYDEVHLYRAYPKKPYTEATRLVRKFGGVTEKTITHEEFGTEPVDVFAIDVSEDVKMARCIDCGMRFNFAEDGQEWQCNDCS